MAKTPSEAHALKLKQQTREQTNIILFEFKDIFCFQLINEMDAPIIRLCYDSYIPKDPKKKNKPTAKCKSCSKIIVGHSSTTSNFRRHSQTHEEL